jgi:LPS sulfotransferase NodH
VRAYILCGTPRTGSTLLCGLLTDHGLGAPHSFYRRQNITEWAEDWGLPSRDTMGETAFQRAYLAAAIAEGKGGTPIFGFRLMKENLSELSAILDTLYPGLPSDRARLEHAFGPVLYLHVSRDDKLAQAISLVRARQSGLWHRAPDGTEIERLAPPQTPAYDFDHLSATLAELEAHDADWHRWFDAEGIDPLSLTYETLVENPAAALARICDALGQPAPDPATVIPATARLSDAVNESWAARFRQDVAER